MLNNILKISFIVFFVGCADDSVSSNGSTNTNSSNLNIITWNIERYPKHEDTNDNLIKIIENLDNIDIFALQEIESSTSLSSLASRLGNEWEYFRYENSDWGQLSFLVNTERINHSQPYSILEEVEYDFAYRPPYVLEFSFSNQDYVLINIHYKCCGDGIITTSSSDEEQRRLRASNHLNEYIQNSFPSSNVIIAGDFNDDLVDDDSNNVFNIFLDNENYLVADMPMAEQNNHWGYWSFPSWPSHLDHIIISDELFDEFSSENSSCNTLIVDDLFNNGWIEYNFIVSDHRPVRISLDVNQE